MFRFIYIRYATSLVKEGTKLLHLATSLFITTFSMNLMCIFTVIDYTCLLLTQITKLLFKVRYIWIGM